MFWSPVRCCRDQFSRASKIHSMLMWLELGGGNLVRVVLEDETCSIAVLVHTVPTNLKANIQLWHQCSKPRTNNCGVILYKNCTEQHITFNLKTWRIGELLVVHNELYGKFIFQKNLRKIFCKRIFSTPLHRSSQYFRKAICKLLDLLESEWEFRIAYQLVVLAHFALSKENCKNCSGWLIADPLVWTSQPRRPCCCWRTWRLGRCPHPPPAPPPPSGWSCAAGLAPPACTATSSSVN